MLNNNNNNNERYCSQDSWLQSDIVSETHHEHLRWASLSSDSLAEWYLASNQCQESYFAEE